MPRRREGWLRRSLHNLACLELLKLGFVSKPDRADL